MLTRPVLRLTLTAVPAGATQLVPAAGEGTGAAACPPLLSPAAPWPPACAAVRRTATHSVAHVRHKLFSCIRPPRDRKSTRLNSSHLGISYAVFCLKKKQIP